MTKTNKKQKIFVGMSGGVDSSVTAALLKKEGHDVSGVFIKGYYPQNIACTWREDRRDAMRVAAILDIPFYTLDFSNEYKKHIIDYMINEYGEGRTPNPDIMCNKYIKFDLFLKKALEMGADKIATGHYVRLQREVPNLKSQIPNKSKIQKFENLNIENSLEIGNWKLEIARDSAKDQSYFLWTLGQEQLKHCMFPIGKYKKEKVRELAKEFKLPTAEKKDSQGLCFVGEFKLEDFLKSHLEIKKGEIVDENGVNVGTHNGVHYYTVGQRHGIGTGGGKKPYYVAKKDISRNILTVVPKEKLKNFSKKEIEIKDVNWILGQTPDLSKEYWARIRYRQPLQKIKIMNCELGIMGKMTVTVEFDESQETVAPGQSLVIYDGEKLVGGGIILL